MKDLHIVINDADIECANCGDVLIPSELDADLSKTFEPGYYNCPNCLMNITISAQTALYVNELRFEELLNSY